MNLVGIWARLNKFVQFLDSLTEIYSAPDHMPSWLGRTAILNGEIRSKKLIGPVPVLRLALRRLCSGIFTSITFGFLIFRHFSAIVRFRIS